MSTAEKECKNQPQMLVSDMSENGIAVEIAITSELEYG